MSRRKTKLKAPSVPSTMVLETVSDSEILGERLRCYALALTAALLVSRAYWTSEPDIRNGAGGGLTWILMLLLAAGLGLVSLIVDGRFRIRIAWTDLAVIVLVGLVGLSATHALDRRPAINIAWEWIGVGVAYLLVRNLPRRRDESVALAGALAATAVALSVYGFYQGWVEFPALKAQFERNAARMLAEAGVAPGGAGEAMFRSRLLGSNDVFSTFGHPNSLAGFLVGPLVASIGVALANLGRDEKKGSGFGPLALAAPLILAVLACLMMTKSRSAELGFGVGVLILIARVRTSVPRRLLVSAIAIGLVLFLLVGSVAWKMGFLDREVFTESMKSVVTRIDYWRGTWGVISEGAASPGMLLGSATFWVGLGPGNFGPAYLLHKLPRASEEIQDPHNMILEVWSTAGIWAMFALLAALGFGLWYTLGPSRDGGPRDEEASPSPTRAARWALIGSGAGWALVVLLGQLNPFENDLFARWLILGAGWLAAVFLGRPLWTRLPLPAYALGAGALAIMVNLLAAGGIGVPTVALCLWTLLALAQNLRDDQPCGRLRTVGGRTTGATALGIWAAVVGLFIGAVIPYWNSEAAIASADAALENQVAPNFEGAEAALRKAIEADPYSSRPWRKLAGLEMTAWQERGAKPEDLRWKTIPISLLRAVSLPRNPDVWSLHAERAAVMTTILSRVGPSLKPIERIQYLGNIVEASRNASRLYPTNPTLHANLAIASAEISMFGDAVTEANEALRLDAILLEAGHLEKRLPDSLRKKLQDQLETWKQRAKEMPVDLPR